MGEYGKFALKFPKRLRTMSLGQNLLVLIKEVIVWTDLQNLENNSSYLLF